jgi:hypothetical protein
VAGNTRLTKNTTKSKSSQKQFTFTCYDWHSVYQKIKVKFALEHAMKAQRGSKGSYFPLTSALDGVTPRPLCTLERDPVPRVQEAGWAPGPVWTGPESKYKYMYLCKDDFLAISVHHHTVIELMTKLSPLTQRAVLRQIAVQSSENKIRILNTKTDRHLPKEQHTSYTTFYRHSRHPISHAN